MDPSAKMLSVADSRSWPFLADTGRTANATMWPFNDRFIALSGHSPSDTLNFGRRTIADRHTPHNTTLACSLDDLASTDTQCSRYDRA